MKVSEEHVSVIPTYIKWKKERRRVRALLYIAKDNLGGNLKKYP
jgi:uncharacterized protein YjiS (DUF1127 family)